MFGYDKDKDSLREYAERLEKENINLRKELDKINHDLPSHANPIVSAFIAYKDSIHGYKEISNIELATYKGSPTFIFGVKSLSKEVIEVLNFMASHDWTFYYSPDDCHRPFPKEHSESIVICAVAPLCQALFHYDQGLQEDWDYLYDIITKQPARSWFC